MTVAARRTASEQAPAIALLRREERTPVGGWRPGPAAATPARLPGGSWRARRAQASRVVTDVRGPGEQQVSMAQQSVAEPGGEASVLVRQRRDQRTAPDPTRADLTARVTDLLRGDTRDEDDVLLPHLQAAPDPVGLRRRGELVRRTAPTRPHAVVSRRGDVLSGLPTAALDRFGDRLETVTRRAPGPPGTAGRTAGDALAGGIGHLPDLQYGERRSTRPSRTGAEQ